MKIKKSTFLSGRIVFLFIVITISLIIAVVEMKTCYGEVFYMIRGDEAFSLTRFFAFNPDIKEFPGFGLYLPCAVPWFIGYIIWIIKADKVSFILSSLYLFLYWFYGISAVMRGGTGFLDALIIYPAYWDQLPWWCWLICKFYQAI